MHFISLISILPSLSDNKLGIPGEEAAGCYGSSEFVGWFNGVPQHSSLKPDLSGETVAIIGHGNVALDCARILAAPLSHLEKTDISEHAVECLRRRNVRNVNLYGRRGVMQFQGTIKEVREFTKLSGVHLSVESDNIEQIKSILPSIPRPKKRLTDLLLKHSSPASPGPEDISVRVKFGWTPLEIKTDEFGHVRGLVVRKNLISGDMMSPDITPTEETIEVACSCVITSIGYKVVKLPGVPFCETSHSIPERLSRVLERPDGAHVPGLYTSGWARRGSDGVLATTITDSANTAMSILEDLEGGVRGVVEGGDVCDVLGSRGVEFVTFEQWREIDSVEKEKGKVKGKPREKLVCYQDMLERIK
jgi:NADPH-dependent glutamate synthase beta subunit-like oxidoreductase